MKEKGRKEGRSAYSFANKRIPYLSFKWGRPAKRPSSRAIQNYNNISLSNSDGQLNYVFLNDEGIPATSKDIKRETEGEQKSPPLHNLRKITDSLKEPELSSEPQSSKVPAGLPSPSRTLPQPVRENSIKREQKASSAYVEENGQKESVVERSATFSHRFSSWFNNKKTLSVIPSEVETIPSGNFPKFLLVSETPEFSAKHLEMPKTPGKLSVPLEILSKITTEELPKTPLKKLPEAAINLGKIPEDSPKKILEESSPENFLSGEISKISPEEEINSGKITENLPEKIMVEASRGKKIPGELTKISPEEDINSGKIPEDSPEKILSGGLSKISPEESKNSRLDEPNKELEKILNGSEDHYSSPETLSRSLLTIPLGSVPENYPGGSATLEGSERTEFTTAESTANLVHSSNINLWRCRWLSWPSSFEKDLSCVSLAACFGNVARLPAMVALHGGAPFMLVYLVLIVFLGIPLAFLELGVGQIVQQGATRTWRAVPMFRGLAYVKLLANMVLCIYYPLYIGLALFYLTWIAKGQIPFTECATAKMGEQGYRTVGIPAEQCLNKTFLESPINDPKWFGIYAAFLLTIWLIIMLCSFRRIKAYIRSMYCFFIPIFICLVALLTKAIMYEIENKSLRIFYEDINWTVLETADVWYYATIQLFFSTHLGFGNVVTCAGKVYNKADPFRAAVSYMIINIILGIVSVLTCFMLMGESLNLNSANKTAELYLYEVIYDHAVSHRDGTHIWTVVAYFTVFLSGFVSLLAAVFTILKAIRVETKTRLHWWQIAAIFCVVFFTLGVFTILVRHFQLVHIFDHYVVGNVVLLSTILEVFAFVYIYGCKNIYIDFEFMVGNRLTIVWKFLWCIAPLLLTAVAIWALATLRLTGSSASEEDPLWIYTTGWTIVGICLVIIVIAAIYEICVQVDYNFVQKFLSALKPSRKWGPVDPMLRHGWIQWRSTAGTGDRDFTLKRRGTRDYTHSVKNRRNTQTLNSNTSAINNTSNSDLVTLRHNHSPTSNLGDSTHYLTPNSGHRTPKTPNFKPTHLQNRASTPFVSASHNLNFHKRQSAPISSSSYQNSSSYQTTNSSYQSIILDDSLRNQTPKTSKYPPIKRHTLEVVSITDTLERVDRPRDLTPKKCFSDGENLGKQPLRNPYGFSTVLSENAVSNDSNSEGYGTIRNGPYVITNGGFDHVCWRRSSQETSTEL